MTQPSDAKALRNKLRPWYLKNHRKLEWRATPGSYPNPYHELVSEYMLQQTQVATVKAYFARFIEALPTLRDLADADEEQVLKLWQGLGYYRRARNLHKAAQMIRDEHHGQVPNDFDALLKLPGVGRYCAGAIASIAFGLRHPVLDGNVMRILARIDGIQQDIDQSPINKQLWSRAEELLPARNTKNFTMGDMNQCLMEFGATLCTPRAPKCESCPVQKLCHAYELGLTEELPIQSKKTKQKEVTHSVYVIEHQSRYLLRQRPDEGLWSGMWEFITLESEKAQPAKAPKAWPFPDTMPEPMHHFKHQTTHRRITFEVIHHVTHHPEAWTQTIPEAQWSSLDQIKQLPRSNPQRKITEML